MRCRYLTELLVTSLLVLVGCSGKPSESEVRQAFDSYLSSKANGLYKLTEFRKTDSQELNVMGVKVVKYSWNAELEFGADSMWSPNDMQAIPMPSSFEMLLHLDKKRTPKGTALRLSGESTYEKTDNGWKVSHASHGYSVLREGAISPAPSAQDRDGMARAGQEANRQQGDASIGELHSQISKTGAVMDEIGKRLLIQLIEGGADPNKRVGAHSLISLAAINDLPDLIEKLLSRGANVNGNGDDGSPLYWAIANGRYASAMLLLKKGADVRITKSGGWTVLDATDELDPKDPRTEQLIRALLDRGAKRK